LTNKGQKQILKLINIFIVNLVFVFLFSSCSNLGQAFKTFSNLKALQFKLKEVNNFNLSNVLISNKRTISDFSLKDGLLLGNAYKNNQLPVSFDLIVLVQNPNSVNNTNNTESLPITLTNLEWDLYLENKKTISGIFSKSITIANNDTEEIPININLDLMRFYNDKSYEQIINLVLNLGGVGNKPTLLKLDAKPTFKTKLGNIPYPGRINIIDQEYR